MFWTGQVSHARSAVACFFKIQSTPSIVFESETDPHAERESLWFFLTNFGDREPLWGSLDSVPGPIGTLDSVLSIHWTYLHAFFAIGDPKSLKRPD